jgi:hypothetical protein
MEGEGKRSDPPQWLQVGDESWGPTDLKKHPAQPLPAAPQLPPVWASDRDSSSNLGTVLVAILAVFALGALMFWLSR